MPTTPRIDSRDERILAILRDAAPAVVSGQDIAAEFHVSRAAIAKRVSRLRDVGYSIEAGAGIGYRWLSAPDMPLPAEVRPLLRTLFWKSLRGGGTTASTNDDAKVLARAGEPEGTAVLASEQTAGRGRLGREWASSIGGVYVSGILRPDISPADVSSLALATGVGVARGLGELGVRVSLKWPNDVMSHGRKLAGILLEMSAEINRVDWVVAGCGVNVHRPKRPLDGASYLDDELPGAVRAGLPIVAAAVLEGIASAYSDFSEGGFASVAAEYAELDYLPGRTVTVRDAAGRPQVKGKVSGVDQSGRLIIRSDAGEVAVTAGDVTLRSS